jgi:molybdate transport system permease protein
VPAQWLNPTHQVKDDRPIEQISGADIQTGSPQGAGQIVTITMDAESWRIIWFTFAVALASTALILAPAVGLAWLLARKEWSGKSLVETLVSLPLVLPPVAVGLLLLKLLGRRGGVGRFLHDSFALDIVFTWKAVMIALAVMSFPLAVRGARLTFEEINPRFEQVARTLGATQWRVFWTITLPLGWRGILGGALLAFARALGEFGATIMVAGNIPGHTTTLALAIFRNVELGKDDAAFHFMLWSVIFAFTTVWTSELILARRRRLT